MIALRGLHQALRPAAEYTHAVAESLGIHPRVTSVERSWNEQQRLYERYLRCKAAGRFPSPECPYPANPPGFSAHQFGLAWDSVVPPEQQEAWTAIRRWVGWQVYDHDAVHAELPGWREVVQ